MSRYKYLISYARSRTSMHRLALVAAVATLTSGCTYGGDTEPDGPHLPLDQVWNQTTHYFNTVIPEDPYPAEISTTPTQLNQYLLGCGRRGGAAIPEIYGPPWKLQLRHYISNPTPADYEGLDQAFDALLNQGFTEQSPRETADPRERRLTNDQYVAMIFPGSHGTKPIVEISIESPCFRFDGDTNKDYE